MGYDNPDVYYNPDKFGLTIIGEVEWSEPCYSFDTTVVWKHEDGTFYWASDSGCSCPSPFEDFTSLKDLSSGTKWDAIKELQDVIGQYSDNSYAAPQVADLCAKIASA